jgi:cardiolipin synthase A/B
MKRATHILIGLVLLLGAGCASVHWGFYRTEMEINDPGFLALSEEITDFPLVGGNKIEFLYNGDNIFSAMFAAIEGAKESIHLETYILYEDGIGLELCDLLMKKARQGVEVRLIYDYFGGLISEKTRRRLTKAGVKHHRYNDWSWLHVLRANVRTHRKILVVDGRIGFTGGVGFADGWKGDARTVDEYRDTHVRVEGPVVTQLQTLFADNWQNMTGESFEGERYYPTQPNLGTVMMATVGRYQDEEQWSKVRPMFLMTLAASRRYFYMANAYFSPDPDCYRALQAAVERGVDVRIITPGPDTDIQAMYLVATKNYGRLLEAGIKLYEYQGPLMHAKTFVADGILSTVGSANFTNRAFSFVYESNLLIYDEAIAAEMERQFEVDLARSRQVTYPEWSKRPLSQRFQEQMVGIIEGWM